MAGDHKQLAPITSCILNEYQSYISTSAFDRMTRLHPEDVIMLDVNYRMHPEVCRFPATAFYEWLGCGENTTTRSDVSDALDDFWKRNIYAKIWQSARKVDEYGNKNTSWRRLFFDIPAARSAPAEGQTSLRNFANANMVVALVNAMLTHRDIQGNLSILPEWITIIAPYRDDKVLILEQLGIQVRVVGLEGIKHGTIDSLPGHENEIVLFAITPANEHNPANIGFLADWKRVNVALSRAKVAIWIVGNMTGMERQLNVLAEDRSKGTKNWGLFIMDIVQRGDRIPIRTKSSDMNVLPRDEAQFDIPRTSWTREIGHMSKQASEFRSAWMKNAAANSGSQFVDNVIRANLRKTLLKMQAKFDKREAEYRDRMAKEQQMEDTERFMASMKLNDEMLDKEQQAAEEGQQIATQLANERRSVEEAARLLEKDPAVKSVPSTNAFGLLAEKNAIPGAEVGEQGGTLEEEFEDAEEDLQEEAHKLKIGEAVVESQNGEEDANMEDSHITPTAPVEPGKEDPNMMEVGGQEQTQAAEDQEAMDIEELVKMGKKGKKVRPNKREPDREHQGQTAP
jgi:hypothetical protein